MTSKEFFVETLKDEMPRFDRVFKVVAGLSEEKLSYRPDPKSRNGKELVIHTFGAEAATFPIFLKEGKVDGVDFERVMPTNVSDAIESFSLYINKTMEMVKDMTEKDWDSKAIMTAGGSTIWETSKGGMAWSLLLDLIHHRGQLSTYLRPMGGLVPSIYGPSADSQG